MIPDICTATIDALAPTGADAAGWWVLAAAAAAVLVAGAALLLAARRRGRHRGAPAGAAVGAVVASLVVLGAVVAPAASTPTSASALAGTVDHGKGCTLIRIGDIETQALPAGLVPGDTLQAITATVTNPTDGPVAVELSGAAGAALEGTVVASTVVGGSRTGAARLAPGESTEVALVLSLPTAIGNQAQGLTGRASLTLTATQR